MQKMDYVLNFEMQLRQTVNEWCVIRKLLKENAIIQSWLDALVTRDKVYSEIGQTILNHHYCRCYQKPSELSSNTKTANSSPLIPEGSKDSLAPPAVQQKVDAKENDVVSLNKPTCYEGTEKKLDKISTSVSWKLPNDEHQGEKVMPLPIKKKNSAATLQESHDLEEEEEKHKTDVEEETVNDKKTTNLKEVNPLKVGEPQSSTSECDQVSTSTKGKPRKYSLRLDVVKKTIFRSLKKYYNNAWKTHCDKSIKDSAEIFKEAHKFITKTFGADDQGEMHLFFVALIDNKKRYTHEDPRYEQLRAQIASMLSCFNKNKIDALLKFPEFSKLVVYFLSQPISETFKDRDDPAVLKIYSSQMEDLKLQCQKHLTS